MHIDGPLWTAVVYNGVDPDIFYPEPDSLPSNVILSVGNLIPSKGHELLLRAFGAIEQRHPTLRCEIIGDGPERARLTALGAQLGPAQKISFLGRKARTRLLMPCAAARYSHYLVIMKVWDVFTWKRWQQENPSSPAGGKALKRSSSTAPMAF